MAGNVARAARILLVVLALAGLAAAVAAYLEYKGAITTCPSHTISSGGQQAGPLPVLPSGPPEEKSCATLYRSPEATLLGVHYSVLAPPYFAALLALAIAYARTRGRPAALALGGLLAVGALIVPWLVRIELREGVICGYCTVMHIVIIGMLALLALERLKAREAPGGQLPAAR